MSSRILTILGLFGTCAALGLAAVLIDWRILMDALSRLSWPSLLMAAGLSILTTLLLALRWAVLAAPPRAMPRLSDFINALIAFLFNIFTPAAFGADAYRVTTGRRSGGRMRTAGLVGSERLMGISAYGFAYLAGFVSATAPAELFKLAVVPFCLLTAAPLLVLAAASFIFRRVGASDGSQRFAALWRSFAELSFWRVAGTWLISLAAVATWISCYLAVGEEMGLQIDAANVAMISVATEFSRLLPISIQGIGVREATFGWLATMAGGSFESAFAACAIVYAIHFALIALIALGLFFAQRTALRSEA